MKKILIPFILLTVVMMNSCALYKEYERPDIAFVDSLYNRIPTADDYESIASLTWRELFADTLLHNLIELGLENNTNLEIARLKVEQAEATLRTSKLSFFPDISFSAQAGINQNGLSYSISPTASWEVDIFGRKHNTKEGAIAALASAEAYQQAVQTQLIATIADAYYTLLMLDEQLDISKRTLNTWEENIRTLSALKRAGKTNEAAVLQAKANKVNVEASILSLEKQIIEQENSLSALLGLVPQEFERNALSEQVFPDTLLMGLPLSSLVNRPDVRQAEYKLVEAFYATNVARSYFYPSITLSGTAGWSGVSGNPGDFIFNAVGSLMQPIFNQGKIKAKVKISESQRQEALLNFKQTLLDAGTEANNALISWQTARKRLDSDKLQIVYLKGAVMNTQLLMKNGQADYLEVLTAQKNLLQAELTGTNDKYLEIQSVITLYHALGGGLE
ncbi:MAG: efflux transporter outer membrane subunit [Lentimicrobiaceae bacterium]|nr:efflux transporter outer membrane subunit [Lentimicrobiaceae bacterium]